MNIARNREDDRGSRRVTDEVIRCLRELSCDLGGCCWCEAESGRPNAPELHSALCEQIKQLFDELTEAWADE